MNKNEIVQPLPTKIRKYVFPDIPSITVNQKYYKNMKTLGQCKILQLIFSSMLGKSKKCLFFVFCFLSLFSFLLLVFVYTLKIVKKIN